MKPLLLAAALLLLAPAAAHAQVAAGTVPNTFDAPARPQADRPTATPSSAQPQVPVEPANPASEATLRTVIDQVRRGEIDYGLMTADLAEAMRPQQATVTPMIKGFGPLQSVRLTASERGIDVYEVLFAEAATLWLIGLNDEGKITALRFRPAEEPGAAAAE